VGVVSSLCKSVLFAEHTTRKTQTDACVTLAPKELDLLIENATFYLGILRKMLSVDVHS
jgi:hypothetical protein